MRKQEPRSFAEVGPTEDLAEDVLYWASLFRATPAEAERALDTVEAHPEPDPKDLRPAKRDDSSSRGP